MRVASARIYRWKEKQKAELAHARQRKAANQEEQKRREKALQTALKAIDQNYDQYEHSLFFFPIRSSTRLEPDLADPSTWTKAMMLLEYEANEVAGRSPGRASAS